MSRILFYPHLRDVLKRLPEHYKQRYLEAHASQPVNYLQSQPQLVGRTVLMENYAPGDYYNVPPKVIYPPECDRCLWAGEGIVVGNAQKNEMSDIYPRSWRPKLLQHVFYSEILNRWMIIIVSDRALHLIEKAGGLDSYILSSTESELHSRLAMHLKRDMLFRLISDDFYKDDEQKRATLLQKYSKFILPREEAEWIGLTLEEAVKKQIKLEHQATRSKLRPLKLEFTEELLNRPISDQGEPDTITEPTSTSSQKSTESVFSRLLYGDKSTHISSTSR